MKKMLLFCCLALPHVIHGQAVENDSTSAHELEEITIVAVNQRTDKEKTVYVPSENQRRASSGGVALLSKMAIPQLNVNPLSEAVKTSSGQTVSVFINYHQASKEEIAGLNNQNVLRVEYLEFPTDPRFMRAQFVVNFITKEIKFGGYTKLTGKERLYVNSGTASIYSKLNYKAMEYDLIITGDYDNSSHSGEASAEMYRLGDKALKRIATTADSRHRSHDIFTGFRALWNKSDGLSWRNLATIAFDRTPINFTSGDVEIIGITSNDAYSSRSNIRSKRIGWESEIYANVGRGWSLNAYVQAEYSDNQSGTDYKTPSTHIVNNAHERGWMLRSNAQINKELSKNFGLFVNIVSGIGHTEIIYSGSSEATNFFKPRYGGASLGASIQTGCFSGSFDAGFASENNSINGKYVTDSYPFTHINFRYAPNQKNSFSLWLQYAAMSPDAAMKNPNLIRQNEILYIGGNPELHSSKHIAANIGYTYLPSNMWQLSGYATFFKIIDRQAPIYRPDGPDGLMLKKYFNNGDYNHGQIGARLTGKFLDGRLAVSAAPVLLTYHTTGSNSISYYPFQMNANIDYYYKSLFLNVLWYSPVKYVDGETCHRRRMPSEYSLTIGWAYKGWNAELSFANIFRSSWKLSDDMLKSEWYDSHTTRFGPEYHRRIAISISYTFNYGRKIKSGDEMRKDGTGASAILR